MNIKAQQAVYRNSLFRHLDGIVTAPTAYNLYKGGVTAFLLEKKEVSLENIVQQFSANEGYLNVGLRMLCSQGWLDQQIDVEKDIVSYAINDQSAIAFALFPLYKDVVELQQLSENYHFRRFEVAPFWHSKVSIVNTRISTV